VAGKADVGAKVVVAFMTARARKAWDGGVDGHALAVERASLRGAPELVPEHQWSPQDRVANTSFGEPVQVGATKPDSSDPHKCLTQQWDGQRLLAHIRVTDAAQAKGLHP
jgi:hypothetical protein